MTRILIFSIDDSDFSGDLAHEMREEGFDTEVINPGEIDQVHDTDIAVIDLGQSPPAPPTVHGHGAPMVVIARRTDAEQRAALLDHGADSVLHGDVSTREVVAQVRSITRRLQPLSIGKPSASPSPTGIVLDHDSRHVVVFGRRILLTALEWRLLSVLMSEPGRIFSNDGLMMAVWGSTVGARSTVSAHIRRLRSKIEPEPAEPVLVRTVWRSGYVFAPITDEGNHPDS